MKKVLVCGATGFIGRNIAETLALRRDFSVYGTYFKSPALKNPKIKMVKADLTRQEDVDRAVKGMNIVIQAAATTSGAKDVINQPYYHVTDNAIINSLVFRSAYINKISHLLFFSCTIMYQSSRIPLKESSFDANMDMHPAYFGAGWTKVYLEKMCQFYSGLGKTKFTVARHSNIYGPHDKFDLEKSHVFGATITKVMQAKNGEAINVWGTGEEKRDLLYISDLVNFVILALKKQKENFGLYNVGSGKAVAISDLTDKIIRCANKKLKTVYDSNKPQIKTSLCLDSSKARHSLGWIPKVSLEEGIEKTLAWYKQNYKKG